MLSDDPLRNGAEEILTEDVQRGGRLVVSAISAWEVAMLVSRGRLSLPFAPLDWFTRLAALPETVEGRLTARIMVDSNFLPDRPPRDAMDRIMVAHARAEGLTILTRDQAILDYAARGHVLALEC
jgi:PIN domain nuclease of toxin-antitoxin system